MTKRRITVNRQVTDASSAPIVAPKPEAMHPTSIEVRKVTQINETLSDFQAVASITVRHLRKKAEKLANEGEILNAEDQQAVIRAQTVFNNNLAEVREQEKRDALDNLSDDQLIRLWPTVMKTLRGGE